MPFLEQADGACLGPHQHHECSAQIRQPPQQLVTRQHPPSLFSGRVKDLHQGLRLGFDLEDQLAQEIALDFHQCGAEVGDHCKAILGGSVRGIRTQGFSRYPNHSQFDLGIGGVCNCKDCSKNQQRQHVRRIPQSGTTTTDVQKNRRPCTSVS